MAKQTSLRFNNRVGLVVLLALALLVLLFLLYRGRGGPNPYVDETIKISELLAAAVQLAEAGGDKIVEIRKMDDKQIGQLTKGLTKEGRDEYVTLGDQLSHQLITSGFQKLWPRLQFRSEEKDSAVGVSHVKVDLVDSEISSVVRRDEAVAMDQVAVWIDPLDATQEYTEGEQNPELLKYVTVMICIAVEGKPIAGVIHEPYAEDPRTG
jgi:inositol monophosphatase 3